MNHKQKNQLGFSYIEISVVVIIIGVLCAIMLAGFKPAEKEISLRNSAYQVAGDIRKAQNMAMATIEQGGNVPCGYGIKFDLTAPNSYFIYAENEGDCSVANAKIYNGGTDTIIDPNPINLPDEIEIADIEINGISVSPVDIMFISPDPTTFVNTSSAIGDSSTIILKIKDGVCPLDCWRVKVETSGNIKVFQF